MGEGAFSKVYKIYDYETNKFYALKQTNLESVEDLKQMITETKILAQLQHPNIVKQYEAKINNNFLNTKLELCRFSLQELIQQQKRISCQILQLIVSQCVEGFVYLHKNKIFHRDCKPGNILIGYDNKVKISDFNAAKVVSQTFKQNTQIGSIEYQAPETLKTDYPINSKIDVFSLGLSVMTMILGRSIWYDKNSIEIIQIYMNNTQENLIYDIFTKKCKELQIQVSGSLIEFLQKTTAFSQENRYSMEDCKNSKWITERKYADIEEMRLNYVINESSKILQQKRQTFYNTDIFSKQFQNIIEDFKTNNTSFNTIIQEIENI